MALKKIVMKNLLLAIVSVILSGGSIMANEIEDAIAKTWNYSDPAASEHAFTELQQQYDASSEEWWLVQTQIARTHSLRRQFDTAHHILDAVQQHIAGKPALEVRYSLERGRAFNSNGDREQAVPLFLHAFEQAQEHNLENLAIDAAHMLGIASPPDQQLDWNLKTIAMIEQSEDARVKGWLPSLYNNTGWTYFDRAEYDKAMKLFQQSLQWHAERNTGERHRIALWCVARCYRAMGEVEKALEMQEDILKRAQEANADPSGYTHEELAELYYVKGNKASACEHAGIAHASLSKDEWFVQNETQRLQRLKELSALCEE